ncbi:hypothetical protein ACNO8X_18370 [Mycobacterium sp. PDNC021]|uniref:hypothetical protein n=1 Tax=Mycobacterium sp. PDNC021 TaxID=3391399 RepID=UPI003AADF93A
MEILLVIWLLCGIGSAVIAGSKNRSAFGWFVLGLLLGVFGLVIIAVLPRQAPLAPLGMRSATCLRCNAVQNVPSNDTTYECWQCKLTNEVPGLRRANRQEGPDGPEDMREWLNRVKK